MATEIPSIDDLHQDHLDDHNQRFPEDDLSEGSDNWKRTRSLAGAVGSLHHSQKVLIDDLYLDTARDSSGALDRIGGKIEGVLRKGATPARKSDALRVFGTATTAVAADLLLTSDAGLSFKTGESGVIGANGWVDLDVVGVDTGSQTRLKAGAKLTFDSPPAGISASAELQLDLDEDGEDKESAAAYRARALDQVQRRGQGGSKADWSAWALEVEGISTAYVYPLRAGLGSVDIAVLHAGSGSVRLPDATKRAEVYDYLGEKRPITGHQYRILEVTEEQLDVELAVKGIPSVEWDWDDSTPPTVSAWDSATRTITLDARPSDMLEGHRITIKTTAGDGKGEILEIESLGSGDDIVLKEAPQVAPVSTDIVYAGGELSGTVRDAVFAFLDSLGPAIGDYGTGEWIDTVSPERLESVAFIASTLVRDADGIAPASASTPADTEYPNDDTIPVKTPGEVVIRRLH